MYLLGTNKLHRCHAFISAIESFWENCAKHTICSNKKYKGHLHEFYMAIMSSSGDYMPLSIGHRYVVLGESLLILLCTFTCKIKYNKVRFGKLNKNKNNRKFVLKVW